MEDSKMSGLKGGGVNETGMVMKYQYRTHLPTKTP